MWGDRERDRDRASCVSGPLNVSVCAHPNSVRASKTRKRMMRNVLRDS